MRKKSIVSISVILCVIVGIAGILFVTPYGIGLSPDSLVYIGGARNILAGKGFSMPPANEPIAHFAPFYSLLLAMSGLLGFDPSEGARLLTAALFGLNIFLIFKVVLLTSNQARLVSTWIYGAIAALALVSRPMWDIHIIALTEPVFIASLLAGVWMLTRYLENTGLWIWLLAAGAMNAISILTRYAGISMWGAFCIVILWFGSGPISRRIRHLAIFSCVSLTPFMLWALRNYLVAGTATNRSILFHPGSRVHLEQALTTMANWLMIPEQAGGWLKLGALAALAAVALAALCLGHKRIALGSTKGLISVLPDPVKIIGIFAFIYAIFLFLSVSLFDANTPFDQRLLSPLFICFLVLIAFSISLLDQVIAAHRIARLVTVLFVCLMCAGHLKASYPLISESAREGLGFNNLRWRSSALIHEIIGCDAGIIYSNAPHAVYFHAGKKARKIPIAYVKATNRFNDKYKQELLTMQRELGKGGIFIYFNLGASTIPEDIASLVHDLDLKPLRTYPDGTIYVR